MLINLLLVLVLMVLAIIDIGPIPTTSFLCLYVVIFKPRWFKSLVDDIYRDRNGG